MTLPAIGSIIATQAGGYRIQALLGRGKSGYSYLITRGDDRRVLKIMHDEPAAYYSFGDKLQSEISAYERLRALAIPIPPLLEFDVVRRSLIKGYIEGVLGAQAVADEQVDEGVLAQLFSLAARLAASGLNIDYFPTNFVITPQGLVIYIDYEINPYAEEWSLGRWGIYYWVNTAGMRRFLQTGDSTAINANPSRGVPLTEGLEDRVAALLSRYGRC